MYMNDPKPNPCWKCDNDKTNNKSLALEGILEYE